MSEPVDQRPEVSMDSSEASRALPAVDAGAAVTEHQGSLGHRRALRFVAFFVLVCLLAGGLGAIIWKLTAPVPSVTISNDGSATVTNQALSEFFGADADFMIIGMFGGVGLGTLAWHWFKSWGWPCVLVAIAGAFLASFLTWRLGLVLGPHDFASRLASAPSGNSVSIDLTLRSATACLLWPFGATVPVLLYSALGRDEDKDQERPADAAASSTRRPDGAKTTSATTRSGHRLIRFSAFGRH